MNVSRIDLADKGSPEGIVSLILKLEPSLTIPVPLEELARQLDIEDICALETEGFEGGLITDTARSRGVVLVKNGVTRQRRRFTIGHELGHFLMASHVPDRAGRFLCSRKDLNLLAAKEGDRRARMEVEANRFSSLILLPPPHLRRMLNGHNAPSIEHMYSLAKHFDVSKEAMARAYVDFHPEAIAVAIVHDGSVIRVYRDKNRFPFITAPNGRPVPRGSHFYSRDLQQGVPGGINSQIPDLWIDVERGKPAPAISEQICMQAQGFAMIMLWYEAPEEEEPRNDERTARERWRDQQNSFRR